VIPLAGLYDGCVSALRIHSGSELRAIGEKLGGGYTWEHHEVAFFPFGKAQVFFGVPPA
jgi:hypothetical protein